MNFHPVAQPNNDDMGTPEQLADFDDEDVPLSEIDSLEHRFDDMCEVMSSTVARGKEQVSERGGGMKLLFAVALVAKRRESLELDELRVFVRLNSRKARQLQEKFTASKDRADHAAKCFSTLLAQSTTLILQSSAQDFARAIVDMLEELDGLDAPGVCRTHARVFGDLKGQLEEIAG